MGAVCRGENDVRDEVKGLFFCLTLSGGASSFFVAAESYALAVLFGYIFLVVLVALNNWAKE